MLPNEWGWEETDMGWLPISTDVPPAVQHQKNFSRSLDANVIPTEVVKDVVARSML